MSRNAVQKGILEYLRKKKVVLISEMLEQLEQVIPDSFSAFPLRYRINRTLKNLEKSGDIFIHEDNDYGTLVRLTPAGRHKLRSLHLSSGTGVISTAWDGKWRIVILDVSEEEKEKRNALRYILKKAGFVCVKNSVWITPQPMEHLLEHMKHDLRLTHEVMVIVSSSLDPATERYFWEAMENEVND